MATNNSNITFKGNKLSVLGKSLAVGDKCPDFKLTGADLSDVTLSQFAGKTLVLSVVPSLDTPVCAEQTKRFNTEATSFSDNVVILTISMDLPFAQSRWCGLEGVKNVRAVSDYKYHTFGKQTGTYIEDNGLLARAVFLVDTAGTIQHVEYVDDITHHPDYNAIVARVKELNR